MHTGSFSKLLSVGTTLIFFLSMGNLATQASEGAAITKSGSFEKAVTHILTVPLDQPVVKGFSINFATDIQQNNNQNTNENPTPQPTPTSTESLVDSQVPTAPANVTATAELPTRIKISWTASTDNVAVDHYRVLRSNSINSNYTTLVSTLDTLYYDNTVSPATQYFYTVEVYDSAGNVNRSADVDATTPATPTTTPTSTPDFIVSDITIAKDPNGTPYIYTTVKNIGGAGLTNQILSISIEDITNGKSYGAGYTGEYPAGFTKTIIANVPLALSVNNRYQITAKVDSVNLFSESNENNNTLTKTVSWVAGKKITVCHYTGSAYQEITIDESSWKTGHATHEKDFIKTGERCDVTKPLPVQPRPVASNTNNQETLIQQLKERVKKLELRISDFERQVVDREKTREQRIDATLARRLAGKLLIQPHENGEVWYLDPATLKKFYLRDGESAYQGMRAFGLGISEKDFSNVSNLCSYVKGRIILRVEQKGEAYYMDDACNANYLRNGAAAYEIMRQKALGISNEDIAKIETGELTLQ